MKKYFKCTLLSDIVINASLATEGNMKTLDYIPGSNFLGIVAKKYKDWQAGGKSYKVFHTDEVSFGDAHITIDGSQSYAMPFSLFTGKLKPEVRGEDAKVWVHDILEKNKIKTKEPKKKGQEEKDRGKIQLKQHRGGYLNPNHEYISKTQKRFALKSAQDRTTRKSKDTAMFGFESMKSGQEFIFYIDFKVGDYVDDIAQELEGNQKIGKSKSAQYGQVFIELIAEKDLPKTFDNKNCVGNRLLIYAESNLCFFNEYGQSTFQPSAEDFGLGGKGDFNWAASQIRTYSYSPWNAYRNTTDPQRDCIQKGSVLVFEFESESDKPSEAQIPSLHRVGSFQSEGLGKVLYNPEFLEGNEEDGSWNFGLNEEDTSSNSTEKFTNEEVKDYQTSLGEFLLEKHLAAQQEFEIGKAVLAFMNPSNLDKLSDISSSQWGGIRTEATKIKEIDDLYQKFFGKGIDASHSSFSNINGEEDKKQGMLNTGVAADRYWNKKGEKAKILLSQTIIKYRNLNTTFVVKLAAEMAKWKQKKDKSNNKKDKQKTTSI